MHDEYQHMDSEENRHFSNGITHSASANRFQAYVLHEEKARPKFLKSEQKNSPAVGIIFNFDAANEIKKS